MEFLKVSDLKHLNALQIHEENEMAYVEDTKEYYRWHESQWEKVTIEGTGLSLNLYDLNKSLYSQVTPIDINSYLDFFANYNLNQNAHYYMLLSNNKRYYTVFVNEPHEVMSFEETIIDVLQSISDKIYSVELTEDEYAIEIWLSMNPEEDPEAFFLFPYDAGVVTFG